jgi:hypothetical protein
MSKPFAKQGSYRQEVAKPTTLQKAIKKIKGRKERGVVEKEKPIPILEQPLPGGYGRRVLFMGARKVIKGE